MTSLLRDNDTRRTALEAYSAEYLHACAKLREPNRLSSTELVARVPTIAARPRSVNPAHGSHKHRSRSLQALLCISNHRLVQSRSVSDHLSLILQVASLAL
jgi:hypothetical protein